MSYEMNVQYISHSEQREESHNLYGSQTLRYAQVDNRSISQKRRSTTLERKGFTLIELLVVISVIALLMAILLPALQRVKRQAKAVLCQANLKQWGTTLALYVEDHEGHLPRDMVGREGMWLIRGWSVTDNNPDEPQLLNPVDTEGVACCPMAIRPGTKQFTSISSRSSSSGSVSSHVVGTVGSTFEAWQIISPGPPFRGSYGFNQCLFEHDFDASIPGRLSRRQVGLNIFALRGRAKIPALLDSIHPWGQPQTRQRELPPFREGSAGIGIGRFCINRHNGHVNGLFLDWSVSKDRAQRALDAQVEHAVQHGKRMDKSRRR